MPETAVDKQGNVPLWKNKVRSSQNWKMATPAFDASMSQNSQRPKFRRRVAL
jgi:hypothetical protein